MGVSDRHYFAWLTGALRRFERESGELHAIARSDGADLVVLAGARQNPAVDFVREALGGDRTSVRWLDRFDRDWEVERVDFNALDVVPDAVFDVLMMTRASYMITEPTAFLRETRRMLRPGGLMIIDWLRGVRMRRLSIFTGTTSTRRGPIHSSRRMPMRNRSANAPRSSRDSFASSTVRRPGRMSSGRAGASPWRGAFGTS